MFRSSSLGPPRVLCLNSQSSFDFSEPTSISVETFGTGKLEEARLIELIREHFDLRPYGLIQMLDLECPIYLPTAAYGHFGRDEFPWERTDKADALRAAAGL